MIQTTEQITRSVERMEKEAKGIKAEILKLCWSMRGGVTYNEAMHMSYEDRTLIGELIKDNLDTTKKSGLPYF